MYAGVLGHLRELLEPLIRRTAASQGVARELANHGHLWQACHFSAMRNEAHILVRGERHENN